MAGKMAEIHFDGNDICKFELPVNLGRSDGQYIIYTPALDLCSAGDSPKQAMQNFKDAVFILIEDLIEQGTLHEVLEDLGWEIEDREWTPPEWKAADMIEVCAPAMA